MTGVGQQVARRSGPLNVPSDPIALGEVLAQSGFFADSRGAAQAAVKVMAGAELGLGPVASMTGIYIVKGRVTLSANLIAAAIKRHPAYTYRVREHTTEKCVIEFLEDGESVGESVFTLEDAKTAGLAGGENYKKFAKNMLFARALSNGAKWYCPDVFGGSPTYTPDELGAEIDGETGEVIDVATIAVEEMPPPEQSSEPEVTETLSNGPEADAALLQKTETALGYMLGVDAKDGNVRAVLGQLYREAGYYPQGCLYSIVLAATQMHKMRQPAGEEDVTRAEQLAREHQQAQKRPEPGSVNPPALRGKSEEEDVETLTNAGCCCPAPLSAEHNPDCPLRGHGIPAEGGDPLVL